MNTTGQKLIKTFPYVLACYYLAAVPVAMSAGSNNDVNIHDRVHTHLLTVEATPIERVATDGDAVWDLSQQTKAGIPAAVMKAFGDTLLSETVLGQRRWYSLKHDSCCLIKEESRYHYLLPDSLAETFTVAVAPDISSSKALQTESHYLVTGLHTLTFPIIRRGRCVSDGPVKGRLVVADGDTIAAYMTHETLKYAERVFPDTLGAMPEEVADTLRHITVTRWIELDAPRPVEIMFDMVSDTGISQQRAVIPAEGHVNVSIYCGHPVPGRYVVVLSTQEFTRKIFVFVK